MQLYRYSFKDGYLVPDENGDVTVFVEGNLISIVDKNGNKIEGVRFKYLGNESVSLEKLRYLAKFVNIEVNEDVLMVYPTLRQRTLAINKLMGEVFEVFIHNLLISKNYRVKRQNEIYPSLHNFTLTRWHNRPDFIIEDKVVIEAKIRKNDYLQTLEYSKYFKYGMVVFPFTGECRVPKGWICVFHTIKDQSRFYSLLENLLSRVK
ncbi:hypothetical protein [Saccharolobus islandicus]|uniref:Uncharacterized protein n=6 Tax=Saccharolobus islandicus TaxID=43080 RepID=M9UB89_SACIS|nr:hypothetical protein [Sulfolobus islandicus]ACP38828.1 conserved hypothetical protein [Sulfolobus islandicus M.14.25]ACP56033.1 conserved hypothetical protein [Sulfolobus islandicus M.16.27]ACR42697.1 conserved hypothetical protein [Sulfolobus islandicus M.16.4]ADX83381.1 conserved hypothetical protein [Sulfolobus islandicus HVE10/4]ADX86027.1 conserved hypothetical protein [Sulfolobus islandicus REY15A]